LSELKIVRIDEGDIGRTGQWGAARRIERSTDNIQLVLGPPDAIGGIKKGVCGNAVEIRTIYIIIPMQMPLGPTHRQIHTHLLWLRYPFHP
jgi:hypothetical protein